MTLIETLLELETPDVIQISPNSRQILYSTTPRASNNTGEHAVSTLWLADTGYPGSARQITPGRFNDHAPSWHPSGKSIAFVSDRAKAGEQWAIYQLSIDGEGDVRALTSTENERKIEKFCFSPDGKMIAYISADEKSAEKKASEKEKDDVLVWGEDWAFNRLRLVDVASQEVMVLAAREAHVVDFAWNRDGSQIAFLEFRDPEIESPWLYGTTLSTVDTSTKKVREICTFPSKLQYLQWAGDSLYALAYIDGSTFVGEYAVYTLDLTLPKPSWARYAHGEKDSPCGLGKAGDDVTLYLEDGLEDQIRLLNGPTVFSRRQRILAWDASFTTDSDEMIVAIAVGDVNHPPEVYSVTASGGAMVKLSKHGTPLEGKKFGRSEFLTCTSDDGTLEVDALWLTPASQIDAAVDNAKPREPLPTFVMPHGGPYMRVNEAFDNTYYMWGPLLLDAGYALLLPNYRGSSSRGETFSAHAHGGVGTVEFDDVNALTAHAVDGGYADPKRLIIGGWSQGGFMSFLACVRNGAHGKGWKWKGAVPGAGVTDWDAMSLTSDVGATLEKGLMGKTPWEHTKESVANRRGSALWEFARAREQGVEFPEILILHGEKDVRVPLSQAVGFRRALEGAKVPFEMAVYQREDHMFKERKNMVDMAERVVRFVEKCVGHRIDR